MSGGDFGRLRQEDRDTVTAADAARAQHIGEAVRHLAQRTEADALLTPVTLHMQDGEPAGLALGPAVANVDADVVLRRNLPTELAIDLVVAGSAGQKHPARLVSET